MTFKRAIIFIVALCLVFGGTFSSYGASAQLKTPTIKLTTVESTGKTKVSWEKVDKAVSYKVYTSTNKKSWSLLKTTKSTSAIHTKATAGKKYYYKVKAIAKKSKNNSKYSSVKSKICQYKYPVNAKVTQTGTYPKITWNKVKGAKQYKVYRCYSKNGDYTRLTVTSNLYFTDKKAQGNKTVYYKVTAINSKENTISKSLSPVSIKTKPEVFTVKYTAKPRTLLYASPNNSATKIDLQYMTEVEVGTVVIKSSSTGAWYKIYYKGKPYYGWIPNGEECYTTEKSTFTYTSSNKYAQEAVDLAKEIAMEWNTFYDYDTPTATNIINSKGEHGFDCSGFVVYVITTVLKKDIPTYWITTSIEPLSKTEYPYNAGYEGCTFKTQKISVENLQPGDVIFFSQKSKFDHCGLYLGNGEFAHATRTWGDDGVCIAPLVDLHEESIECIRRYIPSPEYVKPINKTVKVTASGYNYCSTYVNMDANGEKAGRVYRNEEVTLLFTHESTNRKYAYIRTQEGEEVFIMLKNLDVN